MKAKSRAVQELISIIHTSPDLFKANDVCGFESERFKISLTGNTRALSIVTLKVKGKYFPLTYRDKWALEVAALWWFRNVPINGYV